MRTSSYVHVGESDSFPKTDVVIQQYEKILDSRIAEKILKSSTKGTLPTFTDEETAFLKVRAGNSELVVEAPTPNITIKQGNTELNIGHAAEVVKRMEQARPNPLRKEIRIEDTPISEPLSDVEETCITNEWINRTKNHAKEIPKSNKNAYEIRADVLAMALDWVKVKLASEGGRSIIDENTVLATAKKFYNFVERR